MKNVSVCSESFLTGFAVGMAAMLILVIISMTINR